MAPNGDTNKAPSLASVILGLAIYLILVLCLFLPTLNRDWLIYDEKTIYDGALFPTPYTLNEMFELIKEFGLRFNFLSSNLIYSSNSVIRSSPGSLILNMFVNLCLKKNLVLFHLFVLTLHIINTFLVYFILRHFLNHSSRLNRFLIILLTLIWSIHPVMIESVLLSTNFPRLISYIFLLGFLFYFIKTKDISNTITRSTFISVLYFISMLITECGVSLPFILFIISFQETYKNNDFKSAIETSLKRTAPYFAGLVLFACYFLFLSQVKANHLLQDNQLLITLERIFWLSPQIFFHLLKLVFYPQLLSTDQTLFVHLGKAIFDPYAIFCLTFLLVWLFVPFILFLITKRFSNLFFLTWTFFFALLPFLHIFMPSYTLAAERYLYFPMVFLIVGLGRVIFSSQIYKFFISFILIVILILCFIRSYTRTVDWKDNYSFINSTYKNTNNNFLKGIGFGMLAKAKIILEPHKSAEAKILFKKSLTYLHRAKYEIIKLRNKYQNTQPLVIKSYGLDYETLLTKLAYLETSSRCIELNEDHKIGLEILAPFINGSQNLDPRIYELYSHLLVRDKRHDEGKKILLQANSLYPHTAYILTGLFNLHKNEKDKEKYLLELFKYYPYDLDVISKALSFYQENNNPLTLANISYLYGLRTHSKQAFQQALSNFLSLNQLKSSKKVISKLLKIDPNDPMSLYLISKYYYKVKNNRIALIYLKEAFSYSIQSQSDMKLISEIGDSLVKLHILSGNNNEALSVANQIKKYLGNKL